MVFKKGCAIRKTHGMSKTTRLYRIWANMKSRCNNKNFPRYKDYGGRGIKICTEWKKFEVFMEWSIENGYRDDLTIERIDNDKGYDPSNCKFIPRSEQQKNQRSNKRIEFNNEIKTIAEWGRDARFQANDATIRRRLKLGWTDQDAISLPLQEPRKRQKRAA